MSPNGGEPLQQPPYSKRRASFLQAEDERDEDAGLDSFVAETGRDETPLQDSAQGSIVEPGVAAAFGNLDALGMAIRAYQNAQEDLALLAHAA